MSSLFYLGKINYPSPPFPHFSQLSVQFKEPNSVLFWRLDVFLRARFPTYTRHLIEAGIDVIPDSLVEGQKGLLRFATPLGQSEYSF
jgi:hypothetical protein